MNIGYTFADCYKKLMRDVWYEGEVVRPRGKKTLELLNYSFCIQNPKHNLAFIPGRNFSIVHAINEAVMLFSNSNRVSELGLFNANMKNYSDDGYTLNGSYGARISDYISKVIEKLKYDADSRQAVMNIYASEDGLIKETKDVPCTMTLHFMIRNGKLNLHTYMRSNDCIWGTPYDVFMFTTLQQVVANELGIDVGCYYHNASSIHIYEDSFETAYMIISKNAKDISYNCKADITDMQCAACFIHMLSGETVLAFKEDITSQYILRELSEAKDPAYLAIIAYEAVHRGMIKEIDALKDYVKELDFVKDFTHRWELS